MKSHTLIYIVLAVLLMLLALADLAVGAADVPLSSLWAFGALDADLALQHRIMLSLRLPKMLTAVLAGAALSVSGLQMQTLFRNPLAGPSVLGVTAGATLGVAFLVMLGSMLGFVAGSGLMALFAVVGAMAILLLVLGVAARIQNSITLLIVGMMVGSIASALVNVLQNYADPDSLKLFITWTLGSLSAVGWQQMAYMATLVGVGLLLAVGLIKPLNGLILGEEYAVALGVNVRLVRVLLILSTGLMAGGITAYCGPIAFIGVAVPHLARGIFRTSNHLATLPACAMLGANILLLCDIISSSCTYPLPISTLSALFGAPVVIAVILRKK
ncbi:MAG: iron ABC transporter permease [Paludibacteraceae bacterium]|nr:iron ABC transporter permease [Paludibacteraceae bacterium]